MAEQMHVLFAALQKRLEAGLEASQSVVEHPGAKGSAAEANWLGILSAHIPTRYQVDSAFVIDSEGSMSDQLDIVIYDQHHTPILYDQDSQRVIPAESVYAMFEVKPVLNKQNTEYAGAKAASVRQLLRSSAPIAHAGGEFDPKDPVPIVCGLLARESEWSPPFGDAFRECLSERSELERIDLGCVASAGSFQVSYSADGEVALQVSEPEFALARFLFDLLYRLQKVGTVSAIDYGEYLGGIGSSA